MAKIHLLPEITELEPGGYAVVDTPAGARRISAANLSAAASTLAGHYANDNVDADVPGAPAGSRGAKWWATKASEYAASILAKLVSISPRSGWLFPFTDSANNIVGGWKVDASFWTALSGSIDAAIAALQLAVANLTAKLPLTISTRSGWIFAFTDAADNKLFGADTAGDFWTQSHNVTRFFRDGALSAATQAAFYPTADIYQVGDSLTENWLGNPQLAALFTAAGETRAITLSGIGGQAWSGILARQGGVPTQVAFPIGLSGLPEIPASGPATVTVTGSPLSYADPTQAKSLAGYLQVGTGIYGTLTRAAHAAGQTDVYTFTRATPGSIVKVDPAVALMPDNDALTRRVMFSFGGTNDVIPGSATPAATAAQLLANMQAYEARQPTLLKRVGHMMPLWDMDAGSSASARAIYEALLPLARAAFPNRLIDTRAVLQRAGNGSTADNDDIANGLVPRSLYASDGGYGDGTHFSGGAAYSALAQAQFDLIKRNGW
jgi:hypothetical protein